MSTPHYNQLYTASPYTPQIPAADDRQPSSHGYMPPPNRKSPRLPHKQYQPMGLQVDQPCQGSLVVSAGLLPLATSQSKFRTDV